MQKSILTMRRLVKEVVGMGAMLLLCCLGQLPWAGLPVTLPIIQPEGVPIGTLWARDGAAGGEPYIPHEGDILLFGSVTPLYTLTFPFARTWHPWHSTIVVRRTTGDLALLESGGDHHPYVALRSIGERLPDWMTKTYYRPRCWVRRIRQPLTPKQSLELTTFAETQAYKPFAGERTLLLFVLPGRPLPPTYPDREKWFCSELVTEALVVIGLVSPRQMPRPEALAPRDILLDLRFDFSRGWELPLVFSSNDRPPPPGPPLGPR
jgi:hypothetical protein